MCSKTFSAEAQVQAGAEAEVPITGPLCVTTLKSRLKTPCSVPKPKYRFSTTRHAKAAGEPAVPKVQNAKPARRAAVRGRSGAVRDFSAWRKHARPVRARERSSTTPARFAAVPVCKKKRKKIVVTIPPGVDNGKRIAVPNQGDAGRNGGPAGDLVIILHVAPHRYFERNGQDLYCAIPVSMTQAALGSEITVTSLDDKKIKMRIPAGTQHGKLLRLRGEGVPYGTSGRNGDMYIKVLITVPTKLSVKAKQLLEEVAAVQGEDANPKPVAIADLGN